MNKSYVVAIAALLATVACGDDAGETDETPKADSGTQKATTDAGTAGPSATDAASPPVMALDERTKARVEKLLAAADHDFDNPPETTSDDCDVTLSPGGSGGDAGGDSDDAAMLNAAVEDASSWDTICLAPGEYAMEGTVFVSAASHLTIKGIGDKPEDVLLDFADQTDERGFDVTTAGFWIENMWIKNTKGNGVEVKADNDPMTPNVFRKLKVNWDAGSITENGAYSIYPTRSKYVVVEFCHVQGASDAGLYIGQVEHGLVRYNQVDGNVAGLEVENSAYVEVYENDVFDNAGGILALQEAGLTRLTNNEVLIRDNHVHGNNRNNFAIPGSTVSQVPSGTGLMALAGYDIEFRDNLVEGNGTTGLLIVSNSVIKLLAEEDLTFPDGYDPIPKRIWTNNNTFKDNGKAPDEELAGILGMIFEMELTELATVIWDALGLTDEDPQICLGEGDDALETMILFENDFSNACALQELTIEHFPELP